MILCKTTTKKGRRSRKFVHNPNVCPNCRKSRYECTFSAVHGKLSERQAPLQAQNVQRVPMQPVGEDFARMNNDFRSLKREMFDEMKQALETSNWPVMCEMICEDLELKDA